MLAAVPGTEVLATMLAKFGLLMPALSSMQVGLVWGWAVRWFVVVDATTLRTHRLLHARDPVDTGA